MSPSLSIITVCKNALEGFLRTRASIEAQNCRDFEWIIVDGNSIDGTREVLKQLDAPWICIISEPDDGIYDAMNKGLAVARGNRVWFLNAGDTFHDSNSVSAVVDAPPHVDICFGEAAVVGNSDGILGLRSEMTPHKTPGELCFEQFQFGMVVSHQAFVPKLAISPGYRSDKYKLSADLDWMLQILKKNPTSAYLGILCRIQREGASITNWKKSQLERFVILCRHFGLLKTIFNHMYIALRRVKHGTRSGYWK